MFLVILLLINSDYNVLCQSIKFPDSNDFNPSGKLKLVTFPISCYFFLFLDFSVESQAPFIPVLSARQPGKDNLVETPRSVFQQLNIQMQQALARHREALSQHNKLVQEALAGKIRKSNFDLENL